MVGSKRCKFKKRLVDLVSRRTAGHRWDAPSIAPLRQLIMKVKATQLAAIFLSIGVGRRKCPILLETGKGRVQDTCSFTTQMLPILCSKLETLPRRNELTPPEYSLRGSSPRPMAHKTITLTTELREP